ncbi:MAG: amidase family protein [Acutalibacteraceae bacterium]|nr:amidase family protein [Acutalibacteraceae bacterium]
MKYYINEINSAGTIAVDDTILVKDIPATAGSKMLEGFKPLFSAEVVEKLLKEGYTLSGKTNVGEFGLDLMGETSYFADGETTLKGAAAELVKDKKIKAALSVDLNGAPRRAAAVSGVDFIKPTYGTVSRYGIIACACSGEQIGVTAGNAQDVKEILSVIAGHDSKDGTSLPAEKYEYNLNEDVASMKICIISELYDKASDEVKAKLDEFAKKLTAKGAKVEKVSLDVVFAAQTAWQILIAAETCNNLSRFDGVKYGYRTPEYKNIDELYVKSRSEAFSFLTKATIIYGSDVLSKGKYESCYDKSLRIRRVVLNKVKELLSSYDAILTPACSKAEFSVYDTKDAFNKVFEESLFTAVPSITGLPAMVSGGVQLIADSFKESTLLSIAHSAEKEEA